MSSAKSGVEVVAVAIAKSVLDEYEGVVMAAGYLPGAVLPSTLSALAGLDETDAPALVVNSGVGGVTTAIVKGGVLLLHRSVDLLGEMAREVERVTAIPLVDRENSAQEWAQQEALGPGGYDWVDAAATGATREGSQAGSGAAAYVE